MNPYFTDRPFFILAPMDDVTDCVFRSIVADCAAPDLFMTEFVNVDGLQSPGREKLIHKLRRFRKEDNVIAQIWGLKPENFYKTAMELGEMGFIGIDVNMGCPAKSEVKNGACSALINNRPLAVDIIQATKSGAAAGKIKLPVSVKTRLGFSFIDLSWHELLLNQQIDMLTVHFRTRKEMSKVPAHWEYASRIVELRDKISPHTVIVGNGDVMNKQHAEELVEKTGVDGVMIGRGVFQDPYCFSSPSVWTSKTKEEKIDLLKKHVTLFAETWNNRERRFETLKKFAKIYINGFDGASDMRVTIMACQSAEELLELLPKLYNM